MFANHKPAQDAFGKYVEACKSQFDTNSTPYLVCPSKDYQSPHGSLTAGCITQNAKIINKLNSKLREPPRLIFHAGAHFEATVNGKGKKGGYNQSQLITMTELPKREIVLAMTPITMVAAPSGTPHTDTTNGIPTHKQLLAAGWKEVVIKCAPELSSRKVTVGILEGNRKHYSSKHLGAGTINKQAGNTVT